MSLTPSNHYGGFIPIDLKPGDEVYVGTNFTLDFREVVIMSSGDDLKLQIVLKNNATPILVHDRTGGMEIMQCYRTWLELGRLQEQPMCDAGSQCPYQNAFGLNEALERSGRTTRMILEAQRADRAGRAVYVIAASQEQAERFRRHIDRSSHNGIKVECPSPDNFDWLTMRLRGADTNCVVLVDHYAIEDRFRHVLEMLHRFDVKEPAASPQQG